MPAGFVRVADVVALPPSVVAVGEERTARWYDSKLLWISTGAVLVVLGVLALRRR